MTSDEWKIVETSLSTILGKVKLKIDGYYIDIGYVQESVTKYCLAIFINSKFELKWTQEDCEIRRRFCSKHTKSLLTQKDKQKLKRERKAFREEILKKSTYEYYTPYWGSLRLLKSHLIKNNTSIELIEAS